MTDQDKETELIDRLQHQLSTARNEIKNLRQQVTNLKYTHQNFVKETQNDVKEIRKLLRKVSQERQEGNEECQSNITKMNCCCEFPDFKSIGTVESWFCQKRGTPRQGVLCTESQGILTLCPSVVNNPSYALSGLEEFSHLWIIYHFHKTDSNHVRTKVAPPRLNGSKVGVFSTRSPHRPCPIGLSVVKVEKITDNKIYFSGVDMINGTPVLDIKPYIPQYDNPTILSQSDERKVEGDLFNGESIQTSKSTLTNDKMSCREAPDGEEDSIKIPQWIANSAQTKLNVEFTKKSLQQLSEINGSDHLKSAIINVVEEDPRSVYLKQKLGSQFYTFLIKNVHVACKFNDIDGTATIYQIQIANQNCECGIPEWQCSTHGS